MMNAIIKKVIVDGCHEFHIYRRGALIKKCQTLHQANKVIKELL